MANGLRVLDDAAGAGKGNHVKRPAHATSLLTNDMAVRSGTRILSMEGSWHDYQLYIGGRRARFGLPAESMYFLDEPSVLWRIQHCLVKERGGRVHAASGRELPQLFKRGKSGKPWLRNCRRIVHAMRFRLPARNPTTSPTTRHPVPAIHVMFFASDSSGLSNKLSEACRLALSHLSPSFTKVALQPEARSGLFPFASLKCSVALPNEMPVWPP